MLLNAVTDGIAEVFPLSLDGQRGGFLSEIWSRPNGGLPLRHLMERRTSDSKLSEGTDGKGRHLGQLLLVGFDGLWEGAPSVSAEEGVGRRIQVVSLLLRRSACHKTRLFDDSNQ